jgi:hypothetical protein
MTRGTTKELKWRLRDVQVLSIAQKLQDHYRVDEKAEVPYEVIVATLDDWMELHLDRLADDLPELLSTPSRGEAKEFRRHLNELMIRDVRTKVPVRETEVVDVFTGQRVFSFEKLAAMTVYIARHGRDVYKTKLNKLLFYCDFVNYHLSGVSISGARYVHLPFGPVPDRYEQMLKNLELIGTLQIAEGRGYELISAGEDPLPDTLSRQERAVIDWVLENLGSMSASAISEYSHQEKAYRNTRSGEYIAYEYAKFFRKLPEGLRQ